MIKNSFNLQCNFDRIVAHPTKKKKKNGSDDMELFPIFFFFFIYHYETSGTVYGRVKWTHPCEI